MNQSPTFFPGQRCVSATEPELGLGIVVAADSRTIEVSFKAAECSRTYAVRSAPLKRIVFSVGESIVDVDGNKMRITAISGSADNGPIVYQCGAKAVPENLIAQSCDATTPLKRLTSGFIDRSGEFSLRAELLSAQSRIAKSPCKGFIGGKIDLLPHQLSIAEQVASRRIVRVILADETGLGKTIEACLILHRLLLTGRVQRCLICPPETLVHQWFVELLRRFNLMFRIFNQEHLESCSPQSNPFVNDQLGICSLQLLSGNTDLCEKAAEAGWDLVIVDEAHHMHHKSPEYACVHKLSRSSPGLILLSATPEQLGRYDHFLRLQLLDPHRYIDFAQYEVQALRFVELSKVIAAAVPSAVEEHALHNIDQTAIDVPDGLLPRGPNDGPLPRSMTVRQIIDRFGTGRVMLRNTRRAVTGFPQRIVHTIALGPISDDGRTLASGRKNALISDPRSLWLIDLLKSNPTDKFLVICTTKDLVVSLQEAIQSGITVNIGLFHEDMTLLQRDRNAAWFAQEDGARLLLCSEIGSEGRNFQFCKNLVLFDLPRDPEVLEQRIGRIDRIGQGASIHIYVPYVRATPQGTLCRWYHEGLNAFARNAPAAGMVYESMRDELDALLAHQPIQPAQVQECIESAARQSAELSKELGDGRDFLLERSSFNPGQARLLKEAIEQTERSGLAETVATRLFKHYGIPVEEGGNQTWQLNLDYVTDHRFPVPRQEQPLVTYNRKTALSREDIDFVTIDHPMVLGALDLFLSSESGTAAFAVWEDPRAKTLLLEAHFVVECLAPAGLHITRFLPPTLVRVAVDHSGADVTDTLIPQHFERLLQSGPIDKLLAKRSIIDTVLPNMLATCTTIAQKKSSPLITLSLQSMRSLLDEEILRLKDLQRINPMISDEEIALCEQEKQALEKHLADSRTRLDSIRVIWRGKAG